MADLRGKVALVTGATNGIGKVTARELARMGAATVIIGRKPERVQQTVNEIKQAAGHTHVEGIVADLSLMSQVHAAAEQFRRKYDRLDVLINNAGTGASKRVITAEGLERMFALNHLSYFLLTNLLLDVIKASAPARIINVSSDAHASGKIEFDNLQGERSYRPGAYGTSKLANILFTVELARRLEGTGVTANALHPGFVATGFAKNNGKVIAALVSLFVPLVARSPEKGAQTSIYLASSPDVENTSGKYFYDSRATPPAPQAGDMGIAQKLWDVSAELVDLADDLPARI